MMEVDLFSNGQINGLRLNWELNGEISGKRSSLPVLARVKGKHGMYLRVVNAGQENGVRSILETEKFTNMERAQLVKAGILLLTKRRTMRVNLTMDGQMWWATQASCYPYNLGRGRQVSTLPLILGHRLVQVMTNQTNLPLQHHEETFFFN